MKTIWKYKLKLDGVTALTMPIGATPVSVGAQGISPVLWAQCEETQSETEVRSFCVFMTGQQITLENPVFIGTAIFLGGDFVAHIYEAK